MASSNTTTTTSTLVEISLPLLGVSLLPLVGLAYVSYEMGLELESPIVVGILRTFVQLSVLGAILTPIFVWGTQYWEIVAAYLLFMIVLASYEASSRSVYYFKGMAVAVLSAFLLNVSLVSLFSFSIVIQPTPLWDPQYVIPIVGMLLGNCINGVALSTNAILTGLVEQSTEIELYLCFGATPHEASARIMREAVRVGAMPQLNSMAVIGLISIPGMMTGQILGGSPVWEAARYQMLICYLIATMTFGTILTEIWISRQVAFKHERLELSRIIRRPAKTSFLARIADGFRSLWVTAIRRQNARAEVKEDDDNLPNERTSLVDSARSNTASSMVSNGTLDLVSMMSKTQKIQESSGGGGGTPRLELHRISRTVPSKSSKEGRVLFHSLSAKVQPGEIVAVQGPSGIGKSQLLRLVAGLEGLDDNGGDVALNGKSLTKDFPNLTHWRRQVRYVSQHKIDIPGTPKQFIERISSFASWRFSHGTQMPSGSDMLSTTVDLIREWGLGSNALESEWKSLSGGEAQRVHLAIAVASRPAVLLLDESTSALDLSSKTKVETSIERQSDERGVSVLLITHDADQVERMGSR